MTAPALDAFEVGPLLFAEPIALVIGGLAVAALALGLFADAVRRRKITGRPGELPMMRAMLASVSPGRRQLKAGMLLLGTAAVAIALAQPHVKSRGLLEQHGLDLVIAVDVSKSMMVNDVPKARLEQARRLAAALLDKMRGDRAAVVAFAGAAVHFPMTVDHEASMAFLADFGPNDLPVGSDLGEALRASRCLLRPDLYEQLGCPGIIGRRGHGGDPLPGDRDPDADRRRGPGYDPWDPEAEEAEALDPYAGEEEEKQERGKVILLFSDGGDETDKAAEEAVIARQLGIAVFVVGFGTSGGGEVWDVDDLGNRTTQKRDAGGGPVISRRADDGMRGIAEAGGDKDRYLIAPPTGEADPRPLIEALSGVQRGVTARKIKQAKQIYHWFLFPGLMLLLAEALISTRRRKGLTEIAVVPGSAASGARAQGAPTLEPAVERIGTAPWHPLIIVGIVATVGLVGGAFFIDYTRGGIPLSLTLPIALLASAAGAVQRFRIMKWRQGWK